MHRVLKILLPLFVSAAAILAQEKDSIKIYKLDPVTVSSGREIESKITIEVESVLIERADAVSLDKLGRLIPAVKVQTNSRGETLFNLRGAGERQLTLFFDGIPMNIPWDNRIDLSLIPADAIGNISITKGIPSLLYGANAISGIIKVSSLSYLQKSFGKISAVLGENNKRRFSALYSNKFLNGDYLIAASYNAVDGYTLPKSFKEKLLNPSKLRINSYSESINLFGKMNFNVFDKIDLNLSGSIISSNKGVPPEIDVANPRYWKYPVWERFSANIGGEYKFKNESNSILKFYLAATKFKMQIDQFTDISYLNLSDSEVDNDLVLAGNVSYSGFIGRSGLLKTAFNFLSTAHREKFLQSSFKEELYGQNLFSFASEYEHFLGDLTMLIGAGADISQFPSTGGKPGKSDIADYSLNFGITQAFSRDHSVHFSFGRKTRFPSLRETFSGALGRFVPNPNLKAEAALSSELGLSSQFNSGKIDFNIFLTYLNNGIVRVTLPQKQFQRINKETIRTYGLELLGNFNLTEDLSTYFHFTFLKAGSKNSSGKFLDSLEYKPEIISSFIISYSMPLNLSSQIELNYTGREFALKEGSEYFQKLPDYFIVNLKLSYLINLFSEGSFELICRIDNLFDKLYYTQWGLPEAGRSFKAGVIFQF